MLTVASGTSSNITLAGNQTQHAWAGKFVSIASGYSGLALVGWKLSQGFIVSSGYLSNSDGTCTFGLYNPGTVQTTFTITAYILCRKN